MQRRNFSDAPCAIARSLDVVGDWWTPLIVREVLYGVTRFDDLQRWLGIGRNILSRRLQQLVEQGVLRRQPYRDRPSRSEYRLTDKGYAAATVILGLMPFGEQWFFDPGQEPIRLYDRKTDKRVRPLLVDAETGEPLDARELYAGPGPAFPSSESVRRERFEEYYERHAHSA